MPFVEDNKREAQFNRSIGLDDIPVHEKPATFQEQLGAAYRMENTLGSMLNQAENLPDGMKATDYDVWENLTDDERLDEKFVSNAVYSDNQLELDAVRSQRDRELKDKRTLENGGLMATFIASAADPINFIPVGGTAYRTYKTGGSILTNAMATATAAGASTVLTEAELHRTQLTRTYGESAANVTAAALFGGVLGATPGTISKLFSKNDLDEIDMTMNPEQAIAEGGTSTMADRSIGAAQVMQDAQVRGTFARAATKAMAIDPLTRTITSDMSSTRITVSELAENPLDMDAPLGTSVESAIKTHDGKMFEALEIHGATYNEYKKAGGKLKNREYNEEVGKAMRNGSDDPLVQKAADGWRSKLYDPLKKEAIEAKLLPEDVDVATAEEYLNRIWSKEKVAGNMGEFVTTVSRWLDEQQAVKVSKQSEIEALAKSIDDAGVMTLKNVEDIERLIAEYPSKIANEVKSAIKARKGESATNVTKAMKRAIDKIKAADMDVDNESLAAEIAGRIMGTPDGRLPYDYKIGENSAGAVSNNLSGVFQKRSFVIPDEMVEQFLENDIEVLGARYLKNVAPDLELTKKFGDVEMKAEIKRIEQDYVDDIKKATDPKAARKLNKLKERDIRDISAMRDRIRGVYGQVDHDNPWVRAGRVARDLNYMRLLGGVVASSIPDVSRVIGAEGIAKTFSQGLVPLVTNIKGFKAAAREAKLYGVGTDALMGGRAEIIADVADYAAGGTAFERGVRSAATKFSSINLMNQWTGGIKQLHAVVAQTRIGDELTAGKYDARLGQLGISEDNAKNIAKQIQRHGKKSDGTWIFNSKAWDNQDLAMMWGAALRKESDRVIIMPGQEKPLFMSTELGKTIGQFKTFMFSATQRILLSNLQRQDKHYIQGMMGLVSVGMMAYVFKNWDAGREISDDPRVWVMEGIDRSGMLGMLMEANNTIEKVSGNNYGLRPMIGLNAPASRYASRSALDSMVGPTFGLMGTVIETAGAATGQRDWEASDTRAFRRLLPGQNLSLIRQGLDKIEESVQ